MVDFRAVADRPRPGTKEILSRDAGFEWVPSLTFLHERHLRDRALLVYPPVPTSAERGLAEAQKTNFGTKDEGGAGCACAVQ